MVVYKKKNALQNGGKQETERGRKTGWKFSALLPGGGSGSLPVNDGSIVVSDNFYNKEP